VIEVAARAMAAKGIPESDRKLRREFVKRFTSTLHDQLRRGVVEKIGENRDVRWKLAPTEPDLIWTPKEKGQRPTVGENAGPPAT
jgi:hypothetical protein